MTLFDAAVATASQGVTAEMGTWEDWTAAGPTYVRGDGGGDAALGAAVAAVRALLRDGWQLVPPGVSPIRPSRPHTDA